MIWRWLHRHPSSVDFALVAFLLVVSVAAAIHVHDDQPSAVVLEVAGTLPLLVRRRFSVEVTMAVAAVALALIALGAWVVPVQLGVALYTLGSTPTSRRDNAFGAAVIAVIAIAVLGAGGLEFGAAAAPGRLPGSGDVALGESIGSRRAYIREIEDKAARLVEREQENRGADTRSGRGVSADRAQAFHDVIAHALSVIVIQASAATTMRSTGMPSRLGRRSPRSNTLARAALNDLRRNTRRFSTAAPTINPSPTSRETRRALSSVSARTGLNVSLEIKGATRDHCPQALDLSAYRIIQEALTNALKLRPCESHRRADPLRQDPAARHSR